VKLTAHQRQEAIQRLSHGEAQADVARSFNVSQATISRLEAPSPFGASAVAAAGNGF
jgi:transcriptional regulator with XRE-family HTH domain